MTVKLLIALMTVALVVSLWMVVFSVVRAYESDARQFRDTMQISADLVALNSKPALLFGDERGARENLGAFRAVPAIIGAQIERQDGGVFVVYRQRPGGELPADFHRDDPDRLVTVSVIRDGEETLGTLTVLSDTAAVREQMVDNLTRVGSACIIAIVIALLLTVYFRRQLMTPILSLAESAQRVAKGHEFSQPMPVSGNDEIGTLIEAFNLMMAQLQQRDEKLQHYNAELERQVEIRTAELVSARQVAEEASRVKSDFLAIMSHEIRTPMNGIIGLSQLALNRATNPAMRDYLEKICSSSQGLLGVLNDILDFSKLQAGAVVLEHAPFELDTLLDNLRTLFAGHAKAKGLDFEVRVAEGTPRLLVGDEFRIRQVLSNLVGNAVKFTDRGQVTISVEPRPARDGQARLRIAVEDTGVGMSEAQLGRLFKPFSQGDGSITRRFGGTGLGLAISSDVLKLLGAHLDVSSLEGQGTRIGFELALALDTAPDARVARPPRRTVAGQLRTELEAVARRLQGARVLVVEDEAINRQVVREFLALAGIETWFANDGREALACVADRPFDAVLMDLHMPVMGGAEATREIRARPALTDLPVIALSAGVSQAERDACLAAGMNDFAVKPVDPRQLVACLDQWIRFPLCRDRTAEASPNAGGRPELLALSGSVDRLNEFGSRYSGHFRVRLAQTLDQVRSALEGGYVPALLLIDHMVAADLGALRLALRRAGAGAAGIVVLTGAGDGARRAPGEGVACVAGPLDAARLSRYASGLMDQ